MASETSGGRDYSLMEIFVLKFVLADVIIIAALLLAGPIWALAITALLVLSFVLVWYLIEYSDESDAESTPADGAATDSAPRSETAADPVTKLQERYAAGEISEAEFETKLDQLIESNERAEQAGVDTDELELEFERSN